MSSYSIPANDTAGCAFYDSVVVSGGGMNCGYNFGVQYNQGFIEGDIFVDANNNGLFDSNESALAYQTIQVGNYWGYSNQNGHYKIAVVPGTYTVSYSPSGLYAGYALSTASSYTVTVVNGGTSSNNDFGIYLIPGSTNLAVSIVPHTTVSPGFPAWYHVYVNNVGANPTGATLTMQYDAVLNFNYAMPTQSNHNTSTKTLTWNVPVMAPGTVRSYYINFAASVGITLGASTFELVNVTPTTGIDVNLNNNFDSLHQIITGSWDPNNKLVVSSNYSDPAYQVISSVNPDQTIDYTINFQNTGNAPAVNVSVLDELSSDIDAASFVMLGASHNGTFSRNGNKLSFVFPNIMLADSTNNEPESHGYVNFRVKAINGLTAGHTILDKADIYFDFNDAVATNDADLLMINPLGIPSEGAMNASFISPNPIRDFFNLNIALTSAKEISCTVRTIEGRVVRTIAFAQQSIGKKSLQVDASDLSEGVYLIELHDGNNKRTFKVVKTE